MHPDRLQRLNGNDIDPDGAYVLYWMQQSQRTRWNPALDHAIAQANDLGKGVVVCFGVTDDYPEANARHYAFMLDGLRDVAADLADRKIKFAVHRGRPDRVAIALAERAALVVTDRGYLRDPRSWREQAARTVGCAMDQVEGDVVCPVERVSDKHETQARTIRPRIHRVWDEFLQDWQAVAVGTDSRRLSLPDAGPSLDVSDPRAVLDRLDVDRSVGPVTRFTGGQDEAARRLHRFVSATLDGYADGRNEPSAMQSSQLSPYLHFGQISPVEIAWRSKSAQTGDDEDRAALLEELVVRRELSMNFVFHHRDDYDRFDMLPNWARKTLDEHAEDARDPCYTLAQLEGADTHDPFWNAAMREMVHTGFMHNYMRMYWGKKILEWSPDPREAFRRTLHLNNKYFLDGRDANSFANVGWIFGLADRAWTERPVFGKTRYMNANGLKRKFDMDAYCQVVDRLVADEDGG